MLSTATGFQNMLKDGYRHYAGLEEAILRNIEACKEIANLTRTSYGPNCMKKMVVNHIDKIFITSDTATILKEVEVQHPAAKLLAMAAKMQEEDFGDATNYVVTFAGELLNLAEQLIKTGLHPSAIVSGFETGLKETLAILNEIETMKIESMQDQEKNALVIQPALAPKLPNHYKKFADLVAQGCVSCLKDSEPRFDKDNFRVVKLMGSSLEAAELLKGFVLVRAPETGPLKVEKAIVAVFNCPFDPQGGETKGTVLLSNANELLNYSKTEEDVAERIVKEVASSGVNVVAVGGSISELCLHYFSKYNIMVLKIQSKFETARFARCVNASLISKLGAPVKEELGYADLLEVKEVGSTKVTIVRKESAGSKLVTLILRGSTTSQMEEVERVLSKGVSVFKATLADARFVPGGSATESYLAQKIEKFGTTLPGLEQYACAKFGQAFEVFSRILLENAGLNSNEQVGNLASLNADKPATAVDVFEAKLAPVAELKVYDHLATKINAIKLATHAALTVLRIDQIIMAKPSGGPKLGQKKDWDADE